MAVRNDFAPGEVLAAADLNDTFASRVPFAFGTATPTTTTTGFLWYDSNFTPPVGKVWNGSAFVNFSQGPADFSDAATGTYTDSGIDYKYITYTASGTLTVTRAGFADVLVVGGGGGGGTDDAGGGGAGGHLYVTNAYLSATTHTITVGAGGAASTARPGAVGTTSRCGDFYGIAGGGGGGFFLDNGFRGGSGGGAYSTGSGSAGTPGQGNNGGNGATDGGGGGGGAGAAGTNATTNNGGAGGAGLANSITGSSVTRAGGGGGGGLSTAGAGGSGGGGAGATSGVPTSGTANTGGGGGATAATSGNGSSGGSGVVIIRVKV